MKQSQADKIIHFMKINPAGITTHQAYDLIGCTRLAARISDIRKRGYKVLTDSIRVKCRDGSSTYVARYRLDVEEE